MQFGYDHDRDKAVTAHPAAFRSASSFWKIVAGLLIFGVSFGYVEAAVVAYLRSIYAPLRLHFYPFTATELFPLLSLAQLRTLGPEHLLRLKTELGRELATLCMLAGAAVLAARNLREWAAAFVVSFGIWDIAFYGFLKVLLGWPSSLLTWDILFLVPVPWVGPVLAPVLTSLSMMVAGFAVLWREQNGKPVFLTWAHWLGILAGGVIVLAAFMWDFRNTLSGGIPHSFAWPIFLAGELIGFSAFCDGLGRSRKTEPEVSSRAASAR